MEESNGKFVDLRTKTFMGMVGSILAERYELHGLLGSGGMGAVFLGTQKAINRKVAVKVLPRIDPLTAARFQREARTVSKLSHPNTITVFDFGQSEEGYLFLVMEYLEGQTLRELLKTSGPLPPRRAVHMVGQICRSLSEAHSSGIVHRDIKPDNLFLIHRDDDPDFIKVLDFGIAKAMYGDEPDDDITQQGRIVGTPRYMSPEQVLGLPVDHRADIYSLGIILYQLLTGTPPFDDNSTAMLMMKHAHEMPPSFAEKLPPEHLAHMPIGLEAVVMKALSKRPETRQQTIDMFRTELELIMPGPGSTGDRPLSMTGQQPRLQQPPSFTGPSMTPPIGSPFQQGIYNTPDPSISHASLSHPSMSQPMAALPVAPGVSGTGWPPVPQQHTGNHSQLYANPQHSGSYPSPMEPQRQNTGLLLGIAAIAIFFLLGVVAAGIFLWNEQQNALQKHPASTVVKNTPPPVEKVVPQTAMIHIKSTPSGSTIMSQGEFVGETPMTIEVSRDKEEITYTIVHEDFESTSRRFLTASISKDGETWDVDLTGSPRAKPDEMKFEEPEELQEQKPKKNHKKPRWTPKPKDKTPPEIKKDPPRAKVDPPPKQEDKKPVEPVKPRRPKIELLDGGAGPSGSGGAKKNTPKVDVLN